ncbi:hypothetical protein DOTSEDRAFT_165886 [Dothistroma septosporum NZE10]|uniref:3-hydroxyisobutyrate dehydrogenase n=1 Tax=Dothistroma septosporum (strain NZE10 / CBS 128990) TaxID=675120 RepID=N1PW00_DOTSN|nr:hypothetical protein DOTSEDRAFT_165886 [Dothistroma septosporum NZE10]
MAALPKHIGWIGLGLMGYPMATNLIKKTNQHTHFYVYDVVRESVDKFVKEGGDSVHACQSSREVADKSDLIFSMVPEGSHVRSVYLDETSGVLTSQTLSKNKKILIDCSTIDTATSLAVGAACHDQHPSASFYDAPVSGGVKGAENATLTFMLGASESDPNASLLKSLLSLMGSNIFPCGGPSLGLVAKLCNNYTSGMIAIAVSESLNIGIKSGMDPRVLANIYHTSTAQNAICDDWCPAPHVYEDALSSKGYKGGFKVGLMRKDISLAVDTAKSVGAKLALGKEGLGVYEGAAKDEKCKDLDSRVVYRYLGGVEDWKGKANFPEKAEMKRDETRALMKTAKEMEVDKK